MYKTLQDIREMLLKLDDRVLEIDLAHSNMLDTLLDALTIAKVIDAKVSRKWFLAVHSHKKLGKEIRQLLRELNEIKHQVNMSIQTGSTPQS
jgi:hypothetical protein